MSVTRTMVWRYFMTSSYRARASRARGHLPAVAIARRLVGMDRRLVAPRAWQLLALMLCGLGLGCASTPREPATAAPPTATQAVPPVDGRTLGPADAPVTIIEFTDLQCPYCGRFSRETWPELRARYIDTGKVRFVSRDFPLPFHAFAMPAAIAARCAEQQGRYWEFREAVFRQQARLGGEPYAQIAASLGLDTAALEACRRDPEVRRA